MERQHKYEKVIRQKLDSLPTPDVSGLWSGMEALLDKKMPVQEDKKRRVIFGGFSSTVLVAASILTLIGGAFTLNKLTATKPAIALQVNGNNAAEETRTIAESKEQSSQNLNTSTASNNTNDAFIYNKDITNKKEMIGAGSSMQQPNIAALVTNNLTTAQNDQAIAVDNLQPEAFNTVMTGVEANASHLAAADFALTYPAKKKVAAYSDKGFSGGLSLNYPFALGNQKANELDMNGKKNSLHDYVPSAYLQYHLSKKIYVQAELQPVSAQYTPNHTLYKNVNELNPDEKEEKVVKLNKLFYLNLPVSVHYSPVKNLYIGAGVQYSKLKKVILQDEEYYHLIGAGSWNRTETKNEVVVKDPAEVRKQNTGNVVDSVAQSIRKEEVRLLADVNYQHKGFSLGVRYTKSLSDYVNTNFTGLSVKDKNQNIQLYLRYNLFDKRKK